MTLNVARLYLLTKKIYAGEDLIGRKVMAVLPIADHKLATFTDIFKTKRIIIEILTSNQSIYSFLENLKLIMMKGICFIFGTMPNPFGVIKIIRTGLATISNALWAMVNIFQPFN
jgi:hypothetical protein